MQEENGNWTYIPVGDFKPPSSPVTEATRGGVRLLWTALRHAVFREKAESQEEVVLDRPSDTLLRELTPVPDWTDAAAALSHTFEKEWFEENHPKRPIVAIVGPPGCDHAALLRELACQHKLQISEAPIADELMVSDSLQKGYLHSSDASSEAILVIPNLEHWYLRHEEGLATVRDLMEHLLSRQRRAILACDSWAWAYLNHAIGIGEVVGTPQTLAPFDANRLDKWMRRHLDIEGFEFRYGRENELVFPTANADDDDSETKQPPKSAILRSLAAKSRGNLGVALALWRDCLRTAPDDANGHASENHDTSKRQMWLASPSELERPGLEFEIENVHNFILHAVLLHGGLPASTLVKLLPLPDHEVRLGVNTLRRSGILEVRSGRLQVSLASYPFARRQLQQSGFLVDAF